MRFSLPIPALVFLVLVGCATPPRVVAEKMIVEFPIQADKRSEFIDALNMVLVDTRKFDGCLGVTVWTTAEDADRVWLYEEWETREHQAAYLKWRIETGNTSHLSEYFVGDLRFLWLDQH